MHLANQGSGESGSRADHFQILFLHAHERFVLDPIHLALVGNTAEIAKDSPA
jgi:hypothetical protein